MKLENEVLFRIMSSLLDITHLLIRQGNSQSTFQSDILSKLSFMETRMTDYVALLNAAAEEVKANTSLIASIIEVQNKIFAEVQALIAANGANPDLAAAVAALQEAVVAQTPTVASAIAASTSIDELNPDLPVA